MVQGKVWFGCALALCALGCDVIDNAVRGSQGQVQTATLHRCEACAGTGSITQSTEEQLSVTLVGCEVENSGFLGLGDDHIATVSARNDSDRGGLFEFNVFGDYPGGGVIRHAHSSVYIAPHTVATQRMRYTPRDGRISGRCSIIPPVAVVRHEMICPRCNGRGVVN